MTEPKTQQDKPESTTHRAAVYFKKMATNALCAAKVFPVIYSIILIAIIAFYGDMSQSCAFAIGTTAFVTLPFTILCIWLSYALHLCNWYRFHVIAMLSPIAIPLTHTFAPDINQLLVKWVVGGLLAITTCGCIYLFFSPKQQTNQTQTNNNQQK